MQRSLLGDGELGINYVLLEYNGFWLLQLGGQRALYLVHSD